MEVRNLLYSLYFFRTTAFTLTFTFHPYHLIAPNQVFKVYTMSPSPYHESGQYCDSKSLPWFQVHTMKVSIIHDSKPIPWIKSIPWVQFSTMSQVYTMSPSTFHAYYWYAGLLLAPAEGFGQGFFYAGQKKTLLCCFGPFWVSSSNLSNI